MVGTTKGVCQLIAIRVPRLVLIGGSAGSFPILHEVLCNLPAGLPAAFVLATHLPPSREHRSILADILSKRCRMPVAWARDGDLVRGGVLQVAPQDAHLTLGDDGRWRTEPAPSRPRPSVDRLLHSVAATGHGASAIAVVLSGYLSDGADGAQAILDAGGSLLIQGGGAEDSMPRSALERAGAALVLPARLLGPALVAKLTAPGLDAWFRVWPGAPYVSEATEAFGLEPIASERLYMPPAEDEPGPVRNGA
jgi:two-component system, chemotaxis family, protein-glutamate methylesterase/glutaminase